MLSLHLKSRTQFIRKGHGEGNCGQGAPFLKTHLSGQKRKLKKQQQGKEHFSIPQVLTYSYKERKKFMKSRPVWANMEG